MPEALREKYTVVVGLEVHAQLLTTSKIYAADATTFGAEPNTNIGIVTLGYPGTLPKLNRKALEYAIRMGIACNCSISRYNIFDRKNYFYPDLPKGYQLTQDRTPICKGGHVDIVLRSGAEKQIPLNRIHVEEDAGKLMHLPQESDSFVDFNRAGVALIEIVTEPALRSSEEAAALLTELRKLVRYLDICDGNMEEGSMRCDANVSVMKKGETTLGRKVEIKNMNSIRNVQRAIDVEALRQMEELEKGNEIISETRLFDASTSTTHAMRTKEELNDYRYFPDPDLSPVIVDDPWLNRIRDAMPALPRQLMARFVDHYQLPPYDAGVLTDTKEMAAYFEEVCEHTHNYKAVSNWLMGGVKSYLNETGLAADAFPVKPAVLAELIDLIDAGKVSHTIAAQRIFPELLAHPDATATAVAQRDNLLQESNQEALLPLIEEILKEFPLKVEEFKKGKKGIVSMFMGEVMKRSRGKADPKIASELLNKKLTEAQ